MKVLITGYTGIIGKYLLRILLKETRRFDSIVCSSRLSSEEYHNGSLIYKNMEYTADLINRNGNLFFNNYEPNIIFNLAGLSSAGFPDKQKLWETNTSTLINLLESLPKDKITKIVHVSSAVIDNSPYNLYAASKFASEQILKSYAETYNNIDYTIFRPCAVVGAGARHGLLPDIIRKVRDDSSNLELYGAAPGSIKPYLYAGELASIILDNINRQSQIIDVVPRDSIPVNYVAKLVMDYLAKHKQITWRPDKVWPEDQPYIHFDDKSIVHNDSEDAINLAITDIILEEKRNVLDS